MRRFHEIVMTNVFLSHTTAFIIGSARARCLHPFIRRLPFDPIPAELPQRIPTPFPACRIRRLPAVSHAQASSPEPAGGHAPARFPCRLRRKGARAGLAGGRGPAGMLNQGRGLCCATIFFRELRR